MPGWCWRNAAVIRWRPPVVVSPVEWGDTFVLPVALALAPRRARTYLEPMCEWDLIVTPLPTGASALR